MTQAKSLARCERVRSQDRFKILFPPTHDLFVQSVAVHDNKISCLKIKLMSKLSTSLLILHLDSAFSCSPEEWQLTPERTSSCRMKCVGINSLSAPFVHSCEKDLHSQDLEKKRHFAMNWSNLLLKLPQEAQISMKRKTTNRVPFL